MAENPLMHASTFGGNPPASRPSGSYKTKTLSPAHATAGALMLELLNEMQATHPDFVTDVRGKGLMIRMELGRDEVAAPTGVHMLKRGMCAAFTLNNSRMIRLEPPLIISEAEARNAVEILDQALTETSELLATLASVRGLRYEVRVSSRDFSRCAGDQDRPR